MFDIKKPCKECPFLKDSPTVLVPIRMQQIKKDLLQGESFYCHKTIGHDDEGEGIVINNSQMCAGSMIFLEKLNKPNQMMRIGERLGDYNKNNLSGFDLIE